MLLPLKIIYVVNVVADQAVDNVSLVDIDGDEVVESLPFEAVDVLTYYLNGFLQLHIE